MRKSKVFDGSLSPENLDPRVSPTPLVAGVSDVPPSEAGAASSVVANDLMVDDPLPDPEPSPGPDPGLNTPVVPPPLPPSGPIGPGTS